MSEAQLFPVLLTFETRNFTFQAVGATREEAWAALENLWTTGAQRQGADPGLLAESRDDVHEMIIKPGATYVDREPWPRS